MAAQQLLLSLLIPLLLHSNLQTTSAFSPSDGVSSNARRHIPLFKTFLKGGSTSTVNDATVNDAFSSLAEDRVDGTKRVSVLLCPAQFCVPVDYVDLLTSIKEYYSQTRNIEVVAARVAPLSRTEWIKVAKQLPTKKFFDANLSVKVTLDWYFYAMESALYDLFEEGGEDVEVCVIGHSIGGWVARAYLGGLSSSSTAVYRIARERVTSLITLGSPHISPESALVDQTRGLLREIAASETCSSQSLFQRGVKITCVASSSICGKILSTNLEEVVAASSYLPLMGRLGVDVKGDGIVPTNLAFMEYPAQQVEIERCLITGNTVRHAHVLPTPWNLIDGNAPSLRLPEDILWYGSAGVLSQWIKHIA